MSVELTIETVEETIVLELQDRIPAVLAIDNIPELRDELDSKVDKVEGYSLVDDAEIAKLATVQENATANRDDSENADKVHTHSISDVTGLSDRLANELPPMVRQARDVSSGLAVTKPGEQFMVSSHSGTVLYETFGNLFDPSTVVEDYYIATSNGMSTPAAGWAHTDYIRVTPGAMFSIASNTERRLGVAFYTESKDWTGDFFPSGANPLSIIVPANAVYVMFNVKSSTIPQPTEIMANVGAPIPYMPFGANDAKVVTETPNKAALSQVLDFYTSDNLFVPENVVQNLLISSSSSSLIQEAAGWGIFVVPASEGDVFTVYSPSGAVRRRGAAFFDVLSPKLGDVSITGTYNDSGASITVTAPAGAQSFVINTQSPAEPLPDDLMIVRGSTQIPYMPSGELLYVKRSSIRPEIADSGSETKKLSFTFNGTEGATSSIESSESHLRREFVAVPGKAVTAHPVMFNLRSDFINGAFLRNALDDIAPDHVDSWTVGANHGYSLGVCTADSHGKSTTDCGSVWEREGVQYVLANVTSASHVLLANRTANTAVPVGTYTHVSGAANTSPLVVTAVSTRQWYPPFNGYTQTILADGRRIDEEKEVSADTVQFSESLNLLSREDIIAAWIRDGGMPAGWEPDAPCSIAQSTTYTYDRNAQLTIAREWLVTKEIAVADLMGLQFERGDAQTYIVPGSLPFSYQGGTVDYSMGVPADYTLASGEPVFMNSAKLQASGEYAHRVLVVYPNAVFAIGLLPVGDAAYEVRRARTSANAMEIRGSSGKLYFRVLDIGSHTSVVGDQYSAIGYRHILPISTERTAFYAVEGGGATWVYADWHNKEGLDRLPIDVQYPELIGRSFEVIEARNVTAKAGVLAGSLPVIVNAAASSATLILRVQ